MASGNSKINWLVGVLVLAGVAVIILAVVQKQPRESVSIQETYPVDQKTSEEALQAVVSSADPVQVPSIVSSDSDRGPFAIQVYSFQDKAKADAALEKLTQQGYPAYILVSDLGDKGVWHRVRIGSFKDEQQAQGLLLKIREEFQSGIVVKQP